MSDSESEHEESTPRFSKAIIGRILAVALFVALGTFAVVQSLDGGKKEDPNAAIVAGEQDPDSSTKKITDAAANVKETLAEKAKSIAGVFEKEKPEAKAFVPPSGGFKADLSANPATAQKSSFAVNEKSAATSPSHSFGGAPPSKSFGTTPEKKPTLDRFARADNGQPFIGNPTGGFGELKKSGGTATSPLKIPESPFGEKISSKLDEVAKQSGGVANNLKTQVTNKADDLLNRATEKGSELADRFAPPNSGFTPPPRTGGTQSSFGDNAKPAFNSNFAPPVVQKDVAAESSNRFGDQKTQTAPDRFNQDAQAKSTPNAAFDTNRRLAPVTQSDSTSQFGDNLRPAPNTAQPTNLNSVTSNAKSPFDDPPGDNATQNQTAMPNARTAFPQTQRQTVPAQPVAANLSTRFSGGVGGTSMSSAAAVRTKDTPGERNLDGVQAPALTIEKLSPREIQVNQTANFEIVVKNVGRVAADDVTVYDTVPAGTNFKGATPEPTRMTQDQKIEWNIGQILPGQEKRIQIQLQPTRPGEIGSVAQISFATQASMRSLVTKPVLEIVHQAKPVYLIGDDVILDVVVENKGDGPANNVMIQQNVPKQLDFPDGLPNGNRGIEYEIGTLKPGESRRIKLSLKAAQVGKVQNVMFASAEGGLRANHEIPLEVVAPNLVARTEGPTIRYLKRNVTTTFSVANQGTASATNVELIARLPPGLRFMEANNQGRYDPNSNAVYWSLAELARDVEAKVEVKTTPVAVGSQPIKFETFADLNVKANADHPMTVEHLVDVFFDIDDVFDPIEIGGDTSYRLEVVNQGTKAATNVQLQVDFPVGLTPSSVEGSLRHNIKGQQIAFEPINSMSPGDKIDIVIHAKGQSPGDHRVVMTMQTDGRSTPVSKQETTRVYSDR